MDQWRSPGVEPEQAVLLTAIQRFLGLDSGTFPDTLRADVAWPRVLALARFHGVMPLLYESCRRLPAGLVPADATATLRGFYVGTVASNLALATELGRLSALLNAAGIPAISFKGPTLAQTAYRNVGLRGATDLDILIRSRDFAETERLLLADRYVVPKKLAGQRSAEKRITLWITGQYMYLPTSGSWGLDLHTALMPPGYRFPLRFETLYERSHEIQVGQRPVRVFKPEDLLQILCFHGIKNRWERLKHVADVAAVICSTPELDWDAVLAAARKMGAMRILLVGLLLTAELFRLDLPPAVSRRIEQDPKVRLIGGQALDHLLRNAETPFSYAERSMLYLSIQDNVPNRLRYGLYTLARRLAEPLHHMGLSP